VDRSSVIGILLGVTAIVAGNLLEGGAVGSILQGTAAAIVFGGTMGATLLSFPFSDVRQAALSLREVFFGERPDPEPVIRRIVDFSVAGRRNGLVALEPELASVEDPFFRRAVRLAIDGMNPRMLRETLEREIETYEDEKRRVARVWETAGGFAPTVGILGAVLGLIHVMENLTDPSKLGGGIAVAFVATIYGVGSANLVLLPLAKKLQNRLNDELGRRELILEGVLGIQSGVNPYYLEQKLRSFVEAA
jgi:chemotaxis protein MotA